MNSYAAGTDVSVTIPFVDLNGDTITPTALVVRVLDEDENEVSPASVIPLPDPAGNEIEISIEAIDNTLPPGETVGVRCIEAVMTTAAGPITLYISYLIRPAARLVVLQNTFQTWPRAQLVASEMPNLLGWETAVNDNDRQVALMEAFRRLTRLGYMVRWPREVDDQRYLHPGADRRIDPKHWAVMTFDQWNTWYPEVFRQALRMAQVAEANQILGVDKVGDKRRSGILSESIGESSMMFRMGKPLDLGVSHQALQYVTGYVDVRMTTGRVV